MREPTVSILLLVRCESSTKATHPARLEVCYSHPAVVNAHCGLSEGNSGTDTHEIFAPTAAY